MGVGFWADTNRLLRTVTGHEIGQPGWLLPESAQDTVAERVMRAVQKDPALLDRVLSGDADALGTVRSIIQTVASELGVVTRNEEERQFVARLTAEGKSREEIETALDEARKRAGVPSRIDLPENPDDLLKRGWIETTHPDAGASGRRTFVNLQTGETVEFDRGKPGKKAFRGTDHYHRPNPDRSSKRNLYLDVEGNPVSDGSKRSHIIPGGS